MKVLGQAHGNGWVAYHGDTFEMIKSIPDESIHYSVSSPPFSSLYVYSNSDRDAGNCRDDDEFFEHFGFLVPELFRIIKPGRNVSMHCMNLPSTKETHGYIGIRDFRGDLIRAFINDEAAEMHKAISRLERRAWEAEQDKDLARKSRLVKAAATLREDLESHPGDTGFVLHSEAVIRKDPVTAMQRTKALGLLHKQITKDSCRSRMGIPDYVLTFRKHGDNPEPVSGGFEYYKGAEWNAPPKEGGVRDSINIWQRYAEPVWSDIETKFDEIIPTLSPEQLEAFSLLMNVQIGAEQDQWFDINPSRTLQYQTARESQDRRHVCPLQLDVIERCLQLYTNHGDIVFSPFGGIGSEGYVSLKMKRRFVGMELKKSYFQGMAHNLKSVEGSEQLNIFDLMMAGAA